MVTKEKILKVLEKYTDVLCESGHYFDCIIEEDYEKIAEEILQEEVLTWFRDNKI